MIAILPAALPVTFSVFKYYKLTNDSLCCFENI